MPDFLTVFDRVPRVYKLSSAIARKKPQFTLFTATYRLKNFQDGDILHGRNLSKI
jgi:hypothetical protein